MEKELGCAVDIDLVRKHLADHFSEVFGIEWTENSEEIFERGLFDGIGTPNQPELTNS